MCDKLLSSDFIKTLNQLLLNQTNKLYFKLFTYRRDKLFINNIISSEIDIDKKLYIKLLINRIECDSNYERSSKQSLVIY